jgi:hypothetical protein
MRTGQSHDEIDWVSVIAIILVFAIASFALHFGWTLR